MTRANDIASLVDSAGDIVAAALDNVAPSNDASALTTGTLAAARLPSTGVNASSLSAGTLAAARLPSTGVDASSLSTGTLDSARLDTSVIVKADTLVGTSAGSQTGHNSTTYNTAFSVTYTPVAWGNKVIINTNLNFWGDVDNDGHASVAGQIKMETSTDGGTTYVTRYESGNSLVSRGGHSRFLTVGTSAEFTLPSSGTSLIIRWQARKTASTRGLICGGMAGNTVTVYEVQS